MTNSARCRSLGRLYIMVESKVAKQVHLEMIEAHGYRDYYTLYLKDGKGKLQIDHILYGKCYISCDIDDYAIYLPHHEILFTKENAVHKLKIIDRRENDEL